ncbi:MAG: helix-turn-helix domain-containing protein [Pseudobdellovibrionaceae bacterium]
MPLDALKVSAETYQTVYSSPFKDSIFFRRDHRFTSSTRDIDCFGNFWSFSFSKFGPQQAFCKTRGEMIEIVGPVGVWTPPYSVIDWNMQPGVLRWYAFMSKTQIPTDLPKVATLVSLPENFVTPSKIEDIFSIVRNAASSANVEKEEAPSSVAAKTKLKLQQNLGSSQSLAGIAQELGYSHAVMTRMFKKNFEISPVEYRTRCRVMESMVLLMLRENNVTQAGFEVGFEDCSAFFRQFKRQTLVSPSRFLESHHS